MTWSNEKAAKVGFLLGQGYSGPAVARQLNDGTSSDVVKRMRRHWGLTDESSQCKMVELRFPLDSARRADLNEQAEALGISPSEFVRRILVCALDDDLYNAVTDGRFK